MSKRPCVLCVDDFPEHLQLRVELLKLCGCDALIATNPSSAIDLASQNEIDLCITDYHLKNGKTGEDVARDLRLVCRGVPIILLTGDDDLPCAVLERFDAVLYKGQVDAPGLFHTIQARLAQTLYPSESLNSRRAERTRKRRISFTSATRNATAARARHRRGCDK